MSANKIKPSFKVDGKDYEFIFTRHLQLEYQKMVDEKKQDSQYQQEIAEYSRLQEQFESVQKKYKEIEEKYFENPLDEELEKVYNKFSDLYEKRFKEFTEYVSTHDAPTQADKYVLFMLGKLTLLALQEQYKLSVSEAEKVWNKFVEESGQQGSMEWLAYLGKVWLTDIDEDTENPFIKAMRTKAEQASNRKAGMTKIKK